MCVCVCPNRFYNGGFRKWTTPAGNDWFPHYKQSKHFSNVR